MFRFLTEIWLVPEQISRIDLQVPEQISSKPASAIYVPVPDTTILTKTSQSLSEKAKKAPPLDEGTGEPPRKKRKRRSN